MISSLGNHLKTGHTLSLQVIIIGRFWVIPEAYEKLME